MTLATTPSPAPEPTWQTRAEDAEARVMDLEMELTQNKGVGEQYMVAVSWLENATGLDREEINHLIARRLARGAA